MHTVCAWTIQEHLNSPSCQQWKLEPSLWQHEGMKPTPTIWLFMCFGQPTSYIIPTMSGHIIPSWGWNHSSWQDLWGGNFMTDLNSAFSFFYAGLPDLCLACVMSVFTKIFLAKNSCMSDSLYDLLIARWIQPRTLHFEWHSWSEREQVTKCFSWIVVI